MGGFPESGESAEERERKDAAREAEWTKLKELAQESGFEVREVGPPYSRHILLPLGGIGGVEYGVCLYFLKYSEPHYVLHPYVKGEDGEVDLAHRTLECHTIKTVIRTAEIRDKSYVVEKQEKEEVDKLRGLILAFKFKELGTIDSSFLNVVYPYIIPKLPENILKELRKIKISELEEKLKDIVALRSEFTRKDYVSIVSNLIVDNVLCGTDEGEYSDVEDILNEKVGDLLDEHIRYQVEMSYFKNWKELWEKVGAKGDAAEVYEQLTERYAEPHRKYHTLKHIARCIGEFEHVCKFPSHTPEHPNEVEFAIWFHDAIYDPRRKDNEERSAELGYNVCKEAGLSEEFAKRVYDLILVTKHEKPPVGIDELVLVDIDWSIMGELDFAETEKEIRKEYSWVSEEDFRAARIALLESFLARPKLYSTPHFRSKYEKQARKNLRESIVRLRRAEQGIDE